MREVRFALAALIAVCAAAAQSPPGNGSIDGRVVNSLSGGPVRKAIVTLTLNTPQLSVETDAEGRFHFEALPAGIYRLKASHAAFLDHGARRPISLAPGDHYTGAEIRLSPHGVIAGHVFDEDGDPVSGAYVRILRRSYRDGRRQWSFDARPESLVTTNDSGEYRFPKLSPGQYLLQADDQRPEPVDKFGERSKLMNARAYYPGVLTEDAATSVEVTSGSEMSSVDIRVGRVARPAMFKVSGKIIGAPLGSQTMVTFSGASSGQQATAAPPDYLFQTSLPAGQYRIFAQNYPEDIAFGTGTATVSGDLAGVVLAMNTPAEISGRITVAEGGSRVIAGNTGAFLSLKVGADYYVDARALNADDSGKFDAVKGLRPGHYGITGSPTPDGCYTQAVKFGGQEVSPDDFEVVSSGQLEIIANCTAGSITGSATDEDGKPFSGSIVTLIPQEGKSRPVKQTAGDDGTFKFTNLAPGKYKLYAWDEVDEGDWQDPDFLKKYQATELIIGPNQRENVQLRVTFAQ